MDPWAIRNNRRLDHCNPVDADRFLMPIQNQEAICAPFIKGASFEGSFFAQQDEWVD